MASKNRVREEIRTEAPTETLDQVAAGILGDAPPPGADAQPELPPSQNGSVTKRGPGRPRGSGTGTKRRRDYRAERLRRAGQAHQVHPAPPPPPTPEEIAAANDAAARQIAPLVQMAGSEMLDDSFPERPYNDADALQLSHALIPVLNKYAPFIEAWGPELALVSVVLVQASTYRRVIRERKRQLALPAQNVT